MRRSLWAALYLILAGATGLSAQVRTWTTAPFSGPAVPVEAVPQSLSAPQALGGLPSLSALSLPEAPLPPLAAAPESSDPWEAAIARSAARQGADVEAMKQALKAFEKDMGTSAKSVMSHKELEAYLIRSDFKEKYLAAVSYGRQNTRFRSFARAILDLAAEFRLRPEQVEASIKRQRLEWALTNPEQAERVIRSALEKEEMERVSASWEDNPQSQFMKGMMSSIRTKSGKSVEEVARQGAFAYVKFQGSYIQAISSRDPDLQSYDAAFYVVYSHGKFKISLYALSRSNPSALSRFQDWLLRGIPDLQLQD